MISTWRENSSKSTAVESALRFSAAPIQSRAHGEWDFSDRRGFRGTPASYKELAPPAWLEAYRDGYSGSPWSGASRCPLPPEHARHLRREKPAEYTIVSSHRFHLPAGASR